MRSTVCLQLPQSCRVVVVVLSDEERKIDQTHRCAEARVLRRTREIVARGVSQPGDERHAIPTSVGQLGGLANVRTNAVMAELADFLVANFGDAIVLKDQKDAALYFWRLRVPWG